MSLAQMFSVAFLVTATFTFASYVLINNILLEWNDEF
jgi:hypothetical protein